MKIKETPDQLTCPHCGGKKYILTLISGNGIGARVWSDSRCICPMMIQACPIQKCPECGHFYFYEDGNPKEAVIPAGEEEKAQGEACANFFSGMEFTDLISARKDLEKESTTDEQWKRYLLECIYAYNDEKTKRANRDDFLLFKAGEWSFQQIAREVIARFGEDKTITAELYRELGDFDKSIKLCHKLIAAGTDVEAVKQILAHAEQHDPEVFLLQFDR